MVPPENRLEEAQRGPLGNSNVSHYRYCTTEKLDEKSTTVISSDSPVRMEEKNMYHRVRTTLCRRTAGTVSSSIVEQVNDMAIQVYIYIYLWTYV